MTKQAIAEKLAALFTDHTRIINQTTRIPDRDNRRLNEVELEIIEKHDLCQFELAKVARELGCIKQFEALTKGTK